MTKFFRTVFFLIFIIFIITACGNAKERQDADVEVIMFEDGETQEASKSPSYEGVLVDTPIADILVTEQKNSYDTLNVATYIMKSDGIYFIVDCYHDQILYHDNLTDALGEWSVLTDEVHYAHTIATDGVVLVADDTENNRLLVFQKTAQGYVHTQTLENIGMKPHFVVYDERRQAFFAWSSITGELYLLKRAAQTDENGVYPLYTETVLSLDELYGVYVRSFTVLGDEIYFVSGHNNQKLIRAKISESGGALEILAEYDVPDALAGMVQLYQIQDYYYITISTDNTENQDFATIIRAESLDALSAGEYEDVYAEFGISGGTPYYINEIEGRYYMTHHRTAENIIAFDVIDNEIRNVEVVY